jgi:transposase
MKSRTLCLTEGQAHELQAAFLHCRDAADKIRYQAVRLYGTGYPVAQITDVCGCSRRTLLHWTRAYQQRGLTALLDHRQGGNRARLTPEQIEAVQNQLHRFTPAQLLGRGHCAGDGQFWTVPDLARLVERDYGVVYESQTSYRTLLQKCGLSYQRPAKQYKSHSEVRLMDFEEALEKKTDGHCPGRTGHSHPGR